MKTLDEKIAVMTAYKNGARIEVRPYNRSVWEFCEDPLWNWHFSDYRVAETPKVVVPREYGILLNKGAVVEAFLWQNHQAVRGITGELVHVREVLPPDPNLIRITARIEPAGGGSVFFHHITKHIPYARMLEVGATIDFVEVPK